MLALENILDFWFCFKLKRFYKMKYKSAEEGAKAEEIIIPKVGNGSLTSKLQVQTNRNLYCLSLYKFYFQYVTVGLVYKINITACVSDINKAVIESKPLHEKIILTDADELNIFREETDKERRLSVLSNTPFITRQVNTVPELSQ